MSVDQPAQPNPESLAVSATAPGRFFYQSMEFNVTPSRKLRRAQIALHIFLAVMIIAALLPWLIHAWYWSLLLCGSLMGLFIHYHWVRKRMWQSVGRLISVAGEWWWQAKGTQHKTALTLKRTVVVWPFLIVLPFKKADQNQGGGDLTLILLSDTLAAEDLRRLRVWLRTYPLQSRRKKN